MMQTFEKTFVDVTVTAWKIGDIWSNCKVEKGRYVGTPYDVVTRAILYDGIGSRRKNVRISPYVVMAIRAWLEDIGYY